MLIFAVQTLSLEFECRFSNSFWPDIVGQAYTCEVIGIRNTEEVLVKGVQAKGKGNLDFLAVYLANDNVKSIPLKLGSVFVNLKLLWLTPKLQNISANDFKLFPNLVDLSLPENLLTNIDSDLFKHTPNIKSISFKGSKLKTIGTSLLDGLKHLESADFRSNICIDYAADNQTGFEEMKRKIAANCQ